MSAATLEVLHRVCGGKTPKLVLFDLDGTLIDSVPDIATATDTMLTSLGASPAGEAKVRSWVGDGAATLVTRALKDAHINASQQALAMTLWRAAYTLCCTRKTQLYPGALALLQALSHARIDMALVTNKPVQFAQPILQHLGIAGYFRLVLGGDCVAQKKPAPDMLLEAIDEAGYEKNQCVMVGDSSADINAAKNAGIAVIAVTYGYDKGAPVAAQNPTEVVNSLLALVA